VQQRSLIIIKPDAVQRRLIGELIQRFERKGLKIVAMKMIHMDQALAQRHYAAHRGKDFFDPLIRYITSGPVVVMVLQGPGAIQIVRTMMGPTDSAKAPPGTIRGDFAASLRYNLIHGSDSPEAASQEISLFFKAEELLDYPMDLDEWSGTS